jgi:hypothetical protein
LGSGFDWLTKSIGLKLAQPIIDDAANNITKNLDVELNIISLSWITQPNGKSK